MSGECVGERVAVELCGPVSTKEAAFLGRFFFWDRLTLLGVDVGKHGLETLGGRGLEFVHPMERSWVIQRVLKITKVHDIGEFHCEEINPLTWAPNTWDERQKTYQFLELVRSTLQCGNTPFCEL